MSTVTNVIFSFGVIEPDRRVAGEVVPHIMDDINKWLTENDFGTFGQDIDSVAGGSKHLETNLYAAAFNHFDLDGFISFIENLKWEEPENVQLFVKKHLEDRFSIIDLNI